ncbi:MAG: hypothetical protein PHQ23_05295 [Candidatus Wallbacteria bacterium]|nr:hypothetical protein [Candidatus Wallbacteria bacterium]
MSVYKGQGVLQIDNKEMEIPDLTLDTESATIFGKAPFNGESLKKIEASEEKRYADLALKNIELKGHSIVLKCEYLSEIFISRRNMVGDQTGMRIEFEITPRCSELEFTVEGMNSAVSEIHYGEIKGIHRYEPIEITVGEQKIRLFGNTDSFIAVVKDSDRRTLLEYKEILRLGLSVAMGGEVPYLGYYFQPELKYVINLVHRKASCGGRLIAPLYLSNFLDKFVNSKIGKKCQKYEMALTYYLLGKESDINLLLKIISLFTSVEFFDGSKTMSKERLKQTFGIDSCEAVFYMKFRNMIVHHRGDVSAAVAEARSEAKKEMQRNSTPCEFIENICRAKLDDQKELMKTLIGIKKRMISFIDKHILREIGYTGSYLNCLNSYNEAKLEKIMMRDQQIFERLKNL